MLADELDYVVGVDTHLDEHVLAVVAAPSGAVLARRAVRANARGYAAALRFAREVAFGDEPRPIRPDPAPHRGHDLGHVEPRICARRLDGGPPSRRRTGEGQHDRQAGDRPRDETAIDDRAAHVPPGIGPRDSASCAFEWQQIQEGTG